MPRLHWALVFSLLGSTVVGCGNLSKENYPPGDTCGNTPTCGGVTPGGGSTAPTVDGGAGGSRAGDGGVAASNVTGTVHLISSPNFTDDGTPFTGLATIVAPGPAGQALTASYGGANGNTFSIPGVAAATDWFLVEDGTSGGADILSTYQVVNLPSLAPLTLLVLDKGTLTNLASPLASLSALGISSESAQVILFLTHGGAPYSGVAVAAGAGGAVVAYDRGPGIYTDQAQATGTGGSLILFNAALSGNVAISLTDTATKAPLSVVVQAAPGVATLATVEL